MKTYKLRIHGNEYTVAVNGIKDGTASVNVNGTEYEVEIESASDAATESVKEIEAKPSVRHGGMTISTPLPGIIIELPVREGQNVKRGDKIAVLEAMKMENDILAEQDGTITAIYVTKGDSLHEGDKIARIE